MNFCFSLKKIKKLNHKIKFFPESEWLYYKIYVSEKIGNEIIASLYNIIGTLKSDDLFLKWFFLSYYDPEYHIRLRFYHSDPYRLQKLNIAFTDLLFATIEPIFIKNIQIDTFIREIKRYPNPEKSETIFWLNSIFNTHLHSLNISDYEKWLLNVKYIDNFLDYFHFSFENKYDFINELMLSFREEFEHNKRINKEITKRYNKFKKDIQNILLEEHSPLFLDLIKEERVFLKETNSFFDDHCLIESLSSYLHMNFIRLFPNHNRLNEYLTYCILFKFYKNERGRKKYYG